MSKTIKTTFKLRRGNSSWYKENNPILAEGEPAYELDTQRLKIGDGSSLYNNLSYTNENLVNIGINGLDGSYQDTYFPIPSKLKYGSNSVTWADLINHPFFNPIINLDGSRFFSLDENNYVVVWNYNNEQYCNLYDQFESQPSRDSAIDITLYYYIEHGGSCEDFCADCGEYCADCGEGCADCGEGCADCGEGCADCGEGCNDYSCEDEPEDPNTSDGEYDTKYIKARTTMERLGQDGVQIKDIIPDYFDTEDPGNDSEPLMLSYQINVPSNITTWQQLINNDNYNPTGSTLDDDIPIFRIDNATDMVQAYDGKYHGYREIILLSNKTPRVCNGAPVYYIDSLHHKDEENDEGDDGPERPGYYYRYAPILTCEDTTYYCEDDFSDCGDTYLY